MIRKAFFSLVALVFLHCWAEPLHAQTTCGPGNHWMDSCPAGPVDSFPDTSALVGLDLLVDGNLDGYVDQNLVLNGPATIKREASVDVSLGCPASTADGHDDVIQTEILSMELTSGSIVLRAGLGEQAGPGTLAASPGAICEQATDPARADSSFDVFFEVDLGGGTFVYNQTPLVVSAVIDRVPPVTTYIHVITSPIPLFPTSSPVPGQQPIAQLVTASHRTATLIPTLGKWGLLALVAALGILGLYLLSRRQRSRATHLPNA
jgi:hypothetical protein